MQAANSVVSYLVVQLLVMFVALLLAWRPTRELIWSFRESVFKILVPVLIVMVVKIVLGGKLLAQGMDIKHYRAFLLFDVVMVFLCAYTGLATGLARVITLLVVTLLSLQRLHKSVMPAWMDSLLQLDAANKSYKAMVIVHHIHNSPVGVCFRDLLLDRLAELRMPTSAAVEDAAKERLVSARRSALRFRCGSPLRLA